MPQRAPASRGRRAGGAVVCQAERTRERRRGSSRITPEVPNFEAPLWMDQPLRHVIKSQQFNKEALTRIFEVAREMEEGRIMSTLFYEPSTRTRLSFESAMARLGGTVISTESAAEFSSAAKGETLEDTIRTIEQYADVIVLRHFQARRLCGARPAAAPAEPPPPAALRCAAGSAERAAAAASVPILNAGDGPGQHPTQALLDVYTIQREIGRLEHFHIGLVGDLANGRTVRRRGAAATRGAGGGSAAGPRRRSGPPATLAMFFVAPDVVRMKDDIKDYLDEVNVDWEETRIQKERFQDRPQDYELAKGKYIINTDIMALMKPDAIHPEVDSDPRAAYFRQAKNGLYVRMALLKLALLGDAC
eukprot:scaffold15.g4317.t1